MRATSPSIISAPRVVSKMLVTSVRGDSVPTNVVGKNNLGPGLVLPLNRCLHNHRKEISLRVYPRANSSMRSIRLPDLMGFFLNVHSQTTKGFHPINRRADLASASRRRLRINLACQYSGFDLGKWGLTMRTAMPEAPVDEHRYLFRPKMQSRENPGSQRR